MSDEVYLQYSISNEPNGNRRRPMICTDGQQTFSVKGKMGFIGHMVSLATTQFCCFSTKATTDNMHTCVSCVLLLWVGGE